MQKTLMYYSVCVDWVVRLAAEIYIPPWALDGSRTFSYRDTTSREALPRVLCAVKAVVRC